MMETKNYGYYELNDSLFISRKKKDDKVHGSAKIGDVVFDFTAEGKLVNVEIRHVTDNFLKKFKIDPKDIKGAKLLVTQKQNMIICEFLIKHMINKTIQEQRIPLLVPKH